MCFTGKSENLAETPILKDIVFFDMCASLVKAKILQKSYILKDIFNFLANCRHFLKMLVSSGDI